MDQVEILFALAELMEQDDRFKEISADGDGKSGEVFFVFDGEEYILRSNSILATKD